jgi:hypothetical protein
MPPGRKQRAAASWLSLRLFLLRRSELLGKKKMARNVGGRYGPGHVGALNILNSESDWRVVQVSVAALCRGRKAILKGNGP